MAGPGSQGAPPVPASVARLFEGGVVPLDDRPDGGGEELVIGRLLEEGDSHDLRWAVERWGEARLAAWLAARGDRQLSRRSRRFWRSLLTGGPASPPAAASDTEAAARAALREQLWPL